MNSERRKGVRMAPRDSAFFFLSRLAMSSLCRPQAAGRAVVLLRVVFAGTKTSTFLPSLHSATEHRASHTEEFVGFQRSFDANERSRAFETLHKPFACGSMYALGDKQSY